MAYFKYFPKIGYDIRGAESQRQYDKVTNILARVLVKSHGWAEIDGSIREPLIGASYFVKHIIRDGDRPDILAHQYYGDSELHWLFFFTNGVKLLNPYYDWPLTQYDLKKFVNKKYGSANINAIHHYNDPDGYEIDAVDDSSCISHTSCTPSSAATSVTNWIYEEESNDGKRPIRILQSSMALDVVEEFKSLMKTQ